MIHREIDLITLGFKIYIYFYILTKLTVMGHFLPFTWLSNQYIKYFPCNSILCMLLKINNLEFYVRCQVYQPVRPGGEGELRYCIWGMCINSPSNMEKIMSVTLTMVEYRELLNREFNLL